MSHPASTIREFLATNAVINARRIVQFDATVQTQVLQASSATGPLAGVVDSNVNIPANRSVSVVMLGVAENGVEAGAAFAAGTLLTSDGVGRAIPCIPSAGVNARVIGQALEQAVAAGDVVRVLVSPSMMQG